MSHQCYFNKLVWVGSPSQSAARVRLPSLAYRISWVTTPVCSWHPGTPGTLLSTATCLCIHSSRRTWDVGTQSCKRSFHSLPTLSIDIIQYNVTWVLLFQNLETLCMLPLCINLSSSPALSHCPPNFTFVPYFKVDCWQRGNYTTTPNDA